ncbi:hypothetical protein [Ralstonia sp. UBA689]|uniref:hypothetical protein n=1 Tax=Ralstonia sp. UBA689 TaxID=1947373 RepID=UPI0026006F45|nr:hypothetical protein [Ralstonia sp. UBA689]
MKLEDNRQYLTGALAAREFLQRTQSGLKLHRHFEPKLLRWEYQLHVCEKSAEYQAGFLDAIGVYVLTTLEGVLVELYRWELLKELRGDGGQ